MKLAIFQTAPVLLDMKANLEDIINKIKKAREEDIDLVIFPELALTGYFVGKNYHKVALKLDSEEIKRLVKVTRGTAAVIGFIEESRSMNFYNSALVAVDGEISYTYRKINLPNYGVFEERKIFSMGKKIPTFRYMGFNIAVFICNDLWHPSLPYLGVVQKADVFITIFNSSQGSMGNEFSNIESWELINKFYSRIFGIYNVCANRVGTEIWEDRLFNDCKSLSASGEDKKSLHMSAEDDAPYRFWGGSGIINPFGNHIVKAKLYEEDFIFTELSKDLLRQKRLILPYLRQDDPYFTQRELNRILMKKEDR
ncbi:MAG: nitrilase [Desulfobacula sp.]|nr:nitrilase [Desulfobacula sp.]